MDRENVIKAYEDYVNSYIPVTIYGDYVFEMHKAVLALLKKQEPILVKDIAKEIIGHNPKVKVGRCPCCGQLLSESSKYCNQCGQAVKWE